MEVLKQPQYHPMAVEDQVIILYALSKKHLSDVDVTKVLRFEKDLIHHIEQNASHIKENIRESGELSEEDMVEIDGIIAEIKKDHNYS